MEETVGKMVTLTLTGLVVSFADVEGVFRIASICITTGLTIAVYLHNKKNRKGNKKDEGQD